MIHGIDGPETEPRCFKCGTHTHRAGHLRETAAPCVGATFLCWMCGQWLIIGDDNQPRPCLQADFYAMSEEKRAILTTIDRSRYEDLMRMAQGRFFCAL